MKLNVFGAIVGLSVMSLGLGACAADSGEEAVSDTSANLSDDHGGRHHGDGEALGSLGHGRDGHRVRV
jgi:hypothetical protein